MVHPTCFPGSHCLHLYSITFFLHTQGIAVCNSQSPFKPNLFT
ncbi:hypothetical protein Trydic_g12329, partial [Trypoxylus dichotomus]